MDNHIRQLNYNEFIVWNIAQALIREDYEIVLDGKIISFESCVSNAINNGIDLNKQLKDMFYFSENVESVNTEDYQKISLDKAYVKFRYTDEHQYIECAPGDTLLHLAARHMASNKNNRRHFEILVDNGANPHIVNIYNENPAAVVTLNKVSTEIRGDTAIISWKTSIKVSSAAKKDGKNIIARSTFAHNIMNIKNIILDKMDSKNEPLIMEGIRKQEEIPKNGLEKDSQETKAKRPDAKEMAFGAVIGGVAGAGPGVVMGGMGLVIKTAITQKKLSLNMDVFYIILAAGVAIGALACALEVYKKGQSRG